MSDTTKLIERLRGVGPVLPLAHEAADLIEQQAAELKSASERLTFVASINGSYVEEIHALRDRIAALESAAKAEPVGWAWKPRGGRLDFSDAQDRPTGADLQFAKDNGGEFVPLYTAPAATDNGGGRDAEELSLRALYEDACIQANKNARDAQRYRYLTHRAIITDASTPGMVVITTVDDPIDEPNNFLDELIDAALSQKAGDQG